MILPLGYEYAWWLLPIIIWEVIWKAIAMWKSGRNNQLGWFIVVLIVNSLGIIPILYLLFFQRNGNMKGPNKKNKR